MVRHSLVCRSVSGLGRVRHSLVYMPVNSASGVVLLLARMAWNRLFGVGA